MADDGNINCPLAKIKISHGNIGCFRAPGIVQSMNPAVQAHFYPGNIDFYPGKIGGFTRVKFQKIAREAAPRKNDKNHD